MAWNAPITFVANAVLTAAQLNAQVRDNMSETAAAKATTAGRIFATTGANALAERDLDDDIIETNETTTSTSYTDLATVGPSVTLTTGVRAIVWLNSTTDNNTTGQTSFVSFEVSGATTSAAIDGRALLQQTASGGSTNIRAGVTNFIALTPGSNTFTMKYRVTGGTGQFVRRRLQVMAL